MSTSSSRTQPASSRSGSVSSVQNSVENNSQSGSTAQSDKEQLSVNVLFSALGSTSTNLKTVQDRAVMQDLNVCFHSRPLFAQDVANEKLSNNLQEQEVEDWKLFLKKDEALKLSSPGEGEPIAHSIMDDITGIKKASKAIVLKHKVKPCATLHATPDKYGLLYKASVVTRSCMYNQQLYELTRQVLDVEQQMSNRRPTQVPKGKLEEVLEVPAHSLYALIQAALQQQLKPDQQLAMPAYKHIQALSDLISKQGTIDDAVTTLLSLVQGEAKEQNFDWYEDLYKILVLCMVEAQQSSSCGIAGPFVGNTMAGKYWTSTSTYRLPLGFVMAYVDEEQQKKMKARYEAKFAEVGALQILLKENETEIKKLESSYRSLLKKKQIRDEEKKLAKSNQKKAKKTKSQEGSSQKNNEEKKQRGKQTATSATPEEKKFAETHKQYLGLKLKALNTVTKLAVIELLYGTKDRPMITYVVNNLDAIKHLSGPSPSPSPAPSPAPAQGQETSEESKKSRSEQTPPTETPLTEIIFTANEENCLLLGAHLRAITGRAVDHFHTFMKQKQVEVEKVNPFVATAGMSLIHISYVGGKCFVTDNSTFVAKIGSEDVDREVLTVKLLKGQASQIEKDWFPGLVNPIASQRKFPNNSCVVYPHAGSTLFSEPTHLESRAQLLLQVAKALKELHAINHHYTDLKETNVCVKNGVALLIDLESVRFEFEHEGSFKLTYGFFPPEVFVLKNATKYPEAIKHLGLSSQTPITKVINRNCDVWAFGLLALRSFFTKSERTKIRELFEDKNLSKLESADWQKFNGYQHCLKHLTFVASASIPEAWGELITSCLQGEVKNRKNIDTVITQLEVIIAKTSTTATTTATTATTVHIAPTN